MYYGPAFLQRCNSLWEMQEALFALACIYTAGRHLWPSDLEHSGDIVTLEIGRLLSAHSAGVADSFASVDSRVWALVRQNEREAKLDLLTATGINDLVRRGGTTFVCVDLRSTEDSAARELEALLDGTTACRR